jgi:LysM repeat protein
MVRVMINRPQSLTTMTLVTLAGTRISMVSTPGQFDYQNSAVIGTIDRTGKKKISRAVSPGTATVSFQHTIASPDWHTSVAAQLAQLIEIGRGGYTIRFTNASTIEQSAWWLVTGLSVSVVQRTPQNAPTRVRLSWSLIEAVDVKSGSITPTAVPKAPPVKATIPAVVKKPVTAVKPATTRLYTVVPGDTLFAISKRFLGSGERWGEIWRLNQSIIPNPNLIFPKQVLKIPAA